MTQSTYEARLTNAGAKVNGAYEGLSVNLPYALSRALRERGFNRVTIELVEDGILLRPYASDPQSPDRKATVDLPF